MEMVVRSITLLSGAEYEKYRNIIPEIDVNWWLRSPGEDCPSSFVSWLDHNVSGHCYLPEWESYVRPAVYLGGVNASAGDKISLFAEQWTVLDVHDDIAYVLCDTTIALRRFDKRSCGWEDSELKRWLEKWLKKMQSMHWGWQWKLMRVKRVIRKTYKEEPFLHHFLLPLLAALLLSGSCVGLWFAAGEPTDEFMDFLGWVHRPLLYLFGFFIVLDIVTTVFFVAGSPHKDTLLGHICNILICSVLFYVLHFVCELTFLTLIAQLVVLVGFVGFWRFLCAIKYYS